MQQVQRTGGRLERWRLGARIALVAALINGACAPTQKLVRTPDLPVMEESPIGTPGPFAAYRRLDLKKTIPVGSYPKSVSISPDSRRAYVCNLEGGSVDIFDTTNYKRLSTLKFERTYLPMPDGQTHFDRFEEKPVEIAFTQGGRFVWMSLLRANGLVVFDNKHGALPKDARFKKIRVLDAVHHTRRHERLLFIPTGEQPKVIAVTPDEKWVFVANWRGEGISIIDAHTFRLIKNIHTGANPRGICFVGNKAYVANFGSNTISEISLATLKRTRNLTHVGKNPRHLLAGFDGHSLYVSNHGDGHVRRIDLTTGKTAQSCVVETEPRTICLSAHENFIFAVNYKSDSVSVIDRPTMTPILRVPTLHRPVGVAVNPRNDDVWVTGYLTQSLNVYQFKTGIEKRARQVAMGTPDSVDSPLADNK